MPRRRRHTPPASAGGRGRGRFWRAAAAALLAAAVWVWLQFRHPPAQPASPSPGSHRAAAVPPPSPHPAGPSLPANPASPPPPPLPSPVPAGLERNRFPRPPADVFEAQLALARRGISSGSLDGVMGRQTRAAARAFQRAEALPESGELDAVTLERLALDMPALTVRVVRAADLARLQPLADTWLGKSRQTALEYETLLELVAEQSHASPGLIRALNPGVDWSKVAPGLELRVPDAAYPEPPGRAAFLRISLSSKTLQAFDAATNLLAHFPCSIAARVEKRPLGELRVTAIAPNPNYTFNPELFPESAEARSPGRKLVLPPGPNNPVGSAWIGLDRPGYGIHGTPHPEQVGRTESHGCFRLANWNAEHLMKLVTVGSPVFVEP